ncbi:MAG: NADH-quinone oxidoreductase subunit I [Deltaproteobacteria bacterium]|nr:NADH-quinone oxidoreductase subunit I [Deltaproteobacteria bacterium]TLN00793.1 MAG: NADH-quinone oxidoreductase subunit I [bacterium]
MSTALGKYLKEILTGSWSLLVGMGITLRQTLRRPVTLNYPYESLQMTERFRGHVDLIPNEETGEPNCVVCMACQKACPSNCIQVEGVKPEGAKRRFPTLFLLDFTTCSLCGLCVESCKFNALKYSREYNLASLRKEDYQMDLLDRLGKEPLR